MKRLIPLILILGLTLPTLLTSAEEKPGPNEVEKDGLFSTEGVYADWKVYTEADGLPHHIVFGVTPHGDDVWFATEDGVALLRGGEMKSWHEEDGLPHQAITQVVVDKKTGEVWASTLAGIASFDGNRWTAYTQENSGLCNNCTFGITLHGDDVWVATFDGISRFDRKTKKWKRYYLDNAPLEEVWIYGCEATEDTVDFAAWGGGLVQYYPDVDHWEAHHDPDGSFEMDLIQNDGVISQMTTSVSTAGGWTWVASYFGMCGYDGQDWIENDMDNSGLLSNFINFAKGRGHEGWFATDRGLSCYDVKRERFVNYRKLDGPGPYGEVSIVSKDGKERRTALTRTAIPFNFVWGIAFQGDDIWVATSNGVARGSYGKLGAFHGPELETPVAEDKPKERPDIGFAGKVLDPKYTQPYFHFKKPSTIPLDRPFSDFVDPIGRSDTTFENDSEVRIGFIGCLSGPAKAYSQEMLQGAQMAVEEINAAGGYHGKPVVLKIRDDKASMGINANQTVKLCFEDKVLGFIGSMSSDTTHVALRVALKAEVPEITCISTDPTITQIVVPWIFRCLADDWSQSRALAKYVFKERGFKKVALLEHNNRYGRMGSMELKRVAKRMGVPIKVALKYPSKQKDFKGMLQIIKDYGADAIVNWGLYPQAAKIVTQMKEMGMDIPYFGADGLVSQAFIDQAKDAAEGVVVTYPYDYYRDDPLTKDFNERYKKKHGYEPDSFAAHGYDTLMVMWQAVKRGGLNRARIRDALAETKNFHGVTGMISFDHRGNDMRGVDFAVVKDGKFLPLRMAGDYARKGAHEK
jgi:ABC-type branched-subunit amino acid transport system substrate-binding protein